MFLDDADTNKAKAVDDALKVWTTFANITFQKTTNAAIAHIRISFASGLSNAVIGTMYTKIADLTKPTVNLDIKDVYPPSQEDMADMLHEFGHVLGMRHEHQSPARGQFIHLNELAIFEYWKEQPKEAIKAEIIDEFNLDLVSNYSTFDPKSIMMYVELFC